MTLPDKLQGLVQQNKDLGRGTCSHRKRGNVVRDSILPIGAWNTGEELSSSNRRWYKGLKLLGCIVQGWGLPLAERRLPHTCSNHYTNFMYHMCYQHLNSLLKDVCFSMIINYMSSAQTPEWVSIPVALASSMKPHSRTSIITFFPLGFSNKLILMSLCKALQNLTVYSVLPFELPLVNCAPRNLLEELKGHGSSFSNDFLLLRDAERTKPSLHLLISQKVISVIGVV